MYGRGHQTVRFGPPVTPNVIKHLLIANLAVFVAQALFPLLWQLGSVTPYLFWRQGYLWQPFTYMWLHAGLMHIAFNMLALWMFGSPIALLWGEKKFLRFYLLCGFGAGLIIVTWPAIPVLFGTSVPQGYLIPTLGASGAVFGVLLAYSLTWPDRTIMLLFPPIPIKAIYFIPLHPGDGLGRRPPERQPRGSPRRRRGRLDPAAPDGNDGGDHLQVAPVSMAALQDAQEPPRGAHGGTPLAPALRR